MFEAQPPRVQCLTRQRRARIEFAVNRIVENRETERGKVHANLMRPPGFQLQRQLGRIVQPFAQLVVRHGGFAVARMAYFKRLCGSRPIAPRMTPSSSRGIPATMPRYRA